MQDVVAGHCFGRKQVQELHCRRARKNIAFSSMCSAFLFPFVRGLPDDVVSEIHDN